MLFICETCGHKKLGPINLSGDDAKCHLCGNEHMLPCFKKVGDQQIHRTIIVNMHYTNLPSGVRIDRTTKWGNPFYLPDDTMKTRIKSIHNYEVRLRETPELLLALPELVGKFLLCWCKPLPCHGDILLAIMKERKLIDAECYAL
jgi:hypothetical protein